MNYESNIIILHGWGLNGNKYSKLSSLLKQKGCKVFTPDLPGFGAEPLKSESMTLGDYIDFVEKFIEKNKILKPIIIGHSFGGRVAIKYCWKYPKSVSALILTGVPVIRNVSLSKKIAFLLSIMGRKIFSIFPSSIENMMRKILYFLLGEWDYYKAGRLKQVFKNIVGEDLKGYLREIRIPILLIWGEEDKTVPAVDIKKIKQINSTVKEVIIKETGHKLPYDHPALFLDAIISNL
ncbi:MAG: alpha/beta hydrolase [Candidatus Levyibacteriota bacterium]